MEVYSSIRSNIFTSYIHYAHKKDKKHQNEKCQVTFNLHLFISHDITHQHTYFIKSTRQISPHYAFLYFTNAIAYRHYIKHI